MFVNHEKNSIFISRIFNIFAIPFGIFFGSLLQIPFLLTFTFLCGMAYLYMHMTLKELAIVIKWTFGTTILFANTLMWGIHYIVAYDHPWWRIHVLR